LNTNTMIEKRRKAYMLNRRQRRQPVEF